MTTREKKYVVGLGHDRFLSFLFDVSFCSGLRFFFPIRPIRTYLQQYTLLNARTIHVYVFYAYSNTLGSHAHCISSYTLPTGSVSEHGHNRIIKNERDRERGRKSVKKNRSVLIASSSSCGTTTETKTVAARLPKKIHRVFSAGVQRPVV